MNNAMRRHPASIFPVMAGVLFGCIVAGGIFGFGRLTATGQDDGSAASRIRWLNVSIDRPAGDSPIRVSIRPRLTDAPNESFAHRDTLRAYAESLVREDGLANELIVDAETGEVLTDGLSSFFPSETQSLIGSIIVEDGMPSVWPFADTAPPPKTEQIGRISYPVPDPVSGLLIAYVTRSCSGGCSEVGLVLVYGDSSRMVIDTDTGRAASFDGVAGHVAPAFQRFEDSIRILGFESEGDR